MFFERKQKDNILLNFNCCPIYVLTSSLQPAAGIIVIVVIIIAREDLYN